MSALLILVFVAAIVGVFWYLTSTEKFSKTKHESERWAVIQDSKNDVIAVETLEQEVWLSLKNLNQNQSEMWIGGIVEEYDNYWEFRFDPETIVIAEITIEGAQSNIQGISGDLTYWINVWTKQAYVLAKVIEINE